MGSTAVQTNGPAGQPGTGKLDMKLEVITLPVSDLERAKQFYGGLGWRLDADFKSGSDRAVQFIPPGSACSIHFTAEQAGTELPS